ncbi:MAG: YetF domain-containing protein [Bacteroidota bacterium]
MSEWFYDDIQSILRVGLSCLVFYIVVVIGSKLAGLRSFSDFSSFDFLITLAMGALLATTITSEKVSIVEGTVALAALYTFQIIVAKARQKWGFVKRWVDNPPVLLMFNGEILQDNLNYARITEDELKSKLRQEGICSYEQVKSVVLESSGDVSVIQDKNADVSFNLNMLDGVVKKVKKS